MGRIRVRVVPRSSRTETAGFDSAGRLRVRLTAPPVEGAANRALIGLLAETLEIPRSRIRIARGGAAREKTVEVDGLTDDDLRSRLEAGGETP